jgi:hypothetical protein
MMRLRYKSRILVVALGLLLYLGGCGSEPTDVRFAAIGDMGTAGPGQKRVAAAISARDRDEPIHFLVTLGDNFYPAGVVSTDDPQWTATIEDVYGGLGAPMYATLGNHDHQGLPLAEIRYSDLSDTWHMPAAYYTFSRFLGSGEEVAFFALDTDPIRTGLTPSTDRAPLGQRTESVRRALQELETDLSDALVRYIAERVDASDDFTVSRIVHLARRTGRDIDEGLVRDAIAGGVSHDYEAQLEWLDDRLGESSARWKIVYGHHPLYGHHPTRGYLRTMIDRVEPILVEHGVDLYIAGHDHFVDVMKPIKGVQHVTSGGGNGDDNPYPVLRTDESYYVATGGGFTLFRVTRDQIEIEAVDMAGVTQHTHVFAK